MNKIITHISLNVYLKFFYLVLCKNFCSKIKNSAFEKKYKLSKQILFVYYVDNFR